MAWGREIDINLWMKKLVIAHLANALVNIQQDKFQKANSGLSKKRLVLKIM